MENKKEQKLKSKSDDKCLASKSPIKTEKYFQHFSYTDNLGIKEFMNPEISTNVKNTKKILKNFSQLSENEKKEIFRANVLLQGMEISFGNLVNYNEALCENLDPEDIDKMLKGEVVSFFDPIKKPSKEYKEKTFKKNGEDSNRHFTKLNNNGKNGQNNESLSNTSKDRRDENERNDSNDDIIDDNKGNDKNSESNDNKQTDKPNDDDDDGDDGESEGSYNNNDSLSDGETENSLTLNDLISISQEKRIILIAFVFGENITDTLCDVANRMREEYKQNDNKRVFVYHFDLNGKRFMNRNQILHDLSQDRNQNIIYKLQCLFDERFKKVFNEKLFEDLYVNGDMVFFWDNSEKAVYEKTAKEQLLEIFNEIYTDKQRIIVEGKQKNQQWIVSSMASVSVLENMFGCESYSFRNDESFEFQKHVKMMSVISNRTNLQPYFEELTRSNSHYEAHRVLYDQLELKENMASTFRYLVMKKAIEALNHEELKNLSVLNLENFENDVEQLRRTQVFKNFISIDNFEIYSEYFTFVLAKYIEDNILVPRRREDNENELKLRMIFFLKIISLHPGVREVLKNFLNYNQALKITEKFENVIIQNCQEFMKMITRDSWEIISIWIKRSEKIKAKIEEYKSMFI